MAIAKVNIGQELLNVPMGEMIRSMAFAIAEGQFALDKSSFMSAEYMSGMNILRDLDTGDFLDKYGNPSSDPTKVPVVYDTRIYFGYSKIGG
ncbi:MAG: hypothetical protein GY849_02950, partial [Deltaproteobacteria bacterium]|nr:hypothetical protein [Deltaproteobacteria bacterium]